MTGPPSPLPPPRLLPDFRLALSCLYNLNPQQQPHLSLDRAQDFLIHVQARNMRRRLESLLQRQRDKPGQVLHLADILNNGKNNNGERLTAGSSWLASLALLCQQHHHGGGFVASKTERLFAAQTLLHRLLRSKLREAVDLEMEVASSSSGDGEQECIVMLLQQLQHPIPLPQMIDRYQLYINQYHHPFISSVVFQYQYHPHVIQQSETEEEDRVKGEISLLILAALLYVTAVESYDQTNNSQRPNGSDGNHAASKTGPLLNAIGSTMAAIALRLRFSVSPHFQQQHQSATTTHKSPSLVALVMEALSLVFKTAGSSLHFPACSDCLRACLTAIPDIALGSNGGGARGRMSIDPRCIQESNVELRTVGLNQLWEVLQSHVQNLQQRQQQQQQQQQHQGLEGQVHQNVLSICTSWARFLALPLEFLQHTVPLACQYTSLPVGDARDSLEAYLLIRKAAFAYLVALFEGGTWTPEQVLAKRIGLSSDQQANQQAGKKRQTSKSKRRQQEALNERTTDTMLEEARMESHHRGAMACHTAVMAWEPLQLAFRTVLAETNHQYHPGDDVNDNEIEGEGPIGCLAACANACLPHLLCYSSRPTLAFLQSTELFVAISTVFRKMCQSRHRVVRAFSMEPIFTLHKALIQHFLDSDGKDLDCNLHNAVVDHFFSCSMSLATSCGYPTDYFNDMGSGSDESLEVERNDVRDVLRTISVSERGGSTKSADVNRLPFGITLEILARLLHACADAIQETREQQRIFPETAVHCFSALAKPLNQLSICYAKSGKPDGAVDILRLALQIFRMSLQSVLDGFSSSPITELFPASRIVDLAIASLSPMIAHLCKSPPLCDEVVEVLKLSINAAATSVARLPEVATPSVLGHNMYDIRGAMRSPGGEDHVGCLAIMRLAFESDELACKIVEAVGADIQRLCALHSQLKTIEASREKGTIHGQGVAPKSRRILLGVICHLEIVSNGAAQCATTLTELFNSAVSAIANSAAADDENVVFHICENTWDLTAFSPVIAGSLFAEGDPTPAKTECLERLKKHICRGYQRLSLRNDPSSVDIQWNRLRAAFFSLLNCGISKHFTPQLIDALHAINRSECEAIHLQCQAGPTSTSSIFHEDVVSEDMIPAGLFIRIIEERLDRFQIDENLDGIQSCATVLCKIQPFVLDTILLPCPGPGSKSFSDPRPVLCEAWLLAVTRLAKSATVREEHTVKQVLISTAVAAITIPFHPLLSKSRDVRGQSQFMSLEGPHTLALSNFLCAFFSLGPGMLQELAKELYHKVPIDSGSAEKCGAAIIAASLFRGVQGSLPPWAVESAPEVYASFFFATGKDPNSFGQILHLAMEIRLAATARVGSIEPGHLLSGPLFEGISEKTKFSFLEETVAQCRLNNVAAWKRMKVLLKNVTGGKKQGTDFTQKPSLTKWEFERI